MNPSNYDAEQKAEPAARGFRAEQLTPGDVLKIEGDTPRAYVVRLVWLAPYFLEGETFPRSRITGFTLLATTTVTDREVTLEELQQAIDEGQLTIYKPPLARLSIGLTPEKYHKTK